MISKFILIYFLALFLNSCRSQTNGNSKSVDPISLPTVAQDDIYYNGIVYFSFDNGMNWVNSSHGLPVNISIGLGGIATSSKLLGIATKSNGAYLYNFKHSIWEKVPTDKSMIVANIGAMAIVDSTIFLGTQYKGVFYTNDMGRNWIQLNKGLTNLTIRRFCEFNNILYVCTNDGFYSFNKNASNWKIEYGQKSLQVNGATHFNGRFYLATSKGIFSQQPDNTWINSSPQLSMHNISATDDQLFAMSYNALLVSSTDGINWFSQQNGLPQDLYTFNVLNHNNIILAGQWDGIYRKSNNSAIWELSSKGLPSKFAVTNLKTFNDILVISTTERKLSKDNDIKK